MTDISAKKICNTVKLKKEPENFSYKEEMAFALANAMLPGLIEYQKQKETNQGDLSETSDKHEVISSELSQTVERKKSVDADCERSDQEKADAEKHLQKIQNEPWRFFRWLYMLFFGRGWRKRKADAENRLNEITAQLTQHTETQSSLQKKLQEEEEQKKQIEDKLNQLNENKGNLESVPKIINGIGSLKYPFIPVVVQPASERKGKKTPEVSILLNPNGTNQKDITLPDIKIEDEELKKTKGIIDSFKTDAHFVIPDQSEKDRFNHFNELMGVENKLQDAVKTLNEMVKKSQPRHYKLPIVSKTDSFGHYLLKKSDELSGLDPETIALDPKTGRLHGDLLKTASDMQEILTANARKQAEIDELIESAEKKLIEKQAESEKERKLSFEYQQSLFNQTLDNTFLVRYHHFCPKCNTSPYYMMDKFEIDMFRIGDFEKQPTEKLKRNLEEFQRVTLKEPMNEHLEVEERKKIEESWKKAFEKLRELEGQYLNQVAEFKKNEDEPHNQIKRDVEILQKLYKSIVAELIRNPDKRWIDTTEDGDESGSATEISNNIKTFNNNTKLIYDPDDITSKPWSCRVCQNSFTREEAAQGRVNKIRHDIQAPLFKTLWADNSVWSKTVDLFEHVAKEIRDRRIQEASSLQAPIDQFLADSRQIRAQLQNNFAKSDASNKRIEQMKTEFIQLGLLDELELKQLEEEARESEETRAIVDLEMESMNVKENLIQKRPMLIVFDREVPPSPAQQLSEKLINKHLFEYKQKSESINIATPETTN